MKPLDVINLVRRAKFSGRDYRIKIYAEYLSHVRNSHDKFHLDIYIGYLAKFGLGTLVMDVTYLLYFNGQIHIVGLDAFRPGRWIKAIERSALIEDRNRELMERRTMREEERLHSPIDDSWIFLK